MRALSLMILMTWVVLAAIGLEGCKVSHPTSGPVEHPPVLTHPGQVPAGLQHVSVWLEVFMIAGVPLIVAGLVLLFLAPAAHRLSLALAVGGGGLFVSSALLRVSLWLIPWIAYGLLGCAVLALAYELYVKISRNKNLPDLIQ